MLESEKKSRGTSRYHPSLCQVGRSDAHTMVFSNFCIVSRKPAGFSGHPHSNSTANALRGRTSRNRAFPHNHFHGGPNEVKTKHTARNGTLRFQNAVHIRYPISGVRTFVPSVNINKSINHYQARQKTFSGHIQL